VSDAGAPGERLRCALCHRVETRDFLAQPRGPALAYPLVECTHCHLVFQRDRPDERALELAYREAYGAPQRRFGEPVEAVVRLARSARVRLAARLLPPGGRVLDVGCGRGVFLARMRERGFAVRGTELSQATARNADPSIPIDVGDLAPGRYAPGSFDLISIWHVLEHLREPDTTLRAAREALVPGGHLLLAVPNLDSWQARFGGESWFHLDLPRHLFHFTPATLGGLLRETGFEVLRLTTGQWEMDPFAWVQTALNRTGLRPNALYDALRNHAPARRDLSLALRLGMLAVFPLGMALAIPLSALDRLAGRAGTMIAIARSTPENARAVARTP
jgi:SAM-dependent methyltransferase